MSRGPELDGFEVEGSRVRVTFRHAQGLMTSDGARSVRGFELAGSDGRFEPAEGSIEGERVVLRCSAVTEPVAVRYAWADYPSVNLINGARLPALPFRTDNEVPRPGSAPSDV